MIIIQNVFGKAKASYTTLHILLFPCQNNNDETQWWKIFFEKPKRYVFYFFSHFTRRYRPFTVRVKKNPPSNQTLNTPIYTDESISSFVNPAPVKSQDSACHRTWPPLYNIGGRRTKKIGGSGLSRGFEVPIEPRAK